MSHGCEWGVGRSYSVIVPVGVIFPIRSAKRSVNQSSPSLPSVIPYGPVPSSSVCHSVTVPAGVIRPIVLRRTR